MATLVGSRIKRTAPCPVTPLTLATTLTQHSERHLRREGDDILRKHLLSHSTHLWSCFWNGVCRTTITVWKLLADILEYHRSLISDTARCEAFHQAIQKVVRPGDVVLDIGTGSGLLAMFACQAGARRVYALEEGMIGDLAEELFQKNGMSDRITLLRGRSWDIELPEKVDVVVSETLWNFGLGEGILKTLGDAKRRFLKPDGRIVPERMALHVAPVQTHERHQELARWNRKICGVDMSGAYGMAKSNMYRMVLTPEMLRAESQILCDLELGRDPDWVRGEVEFEVKYDGLIHGLGGWFDAELTDGVRLHNAPPSPAPSWKHAFMPLPEPIEVRAGDLLTAEIQCVGDESAWRWAVRHHSAHRDNSMPVPTLHSQSTLGGFPTALERLAAP